MRNNLSDNTYLISDFQPRMIKLALDNEDWINFINEEIRLRRIIPRN